MWSGLRVFPDFWSLPQIAKGMEGAVIRVQEAGNNDKGVVLHFDRT